MLKKKFFMFLSSLAFIAIAQANLSSGQFYSIHDLQSWSPVTKKSSLMIKRLASPVAALRSDSFACSGFLIAKDLLITNAHCVGAINDKGLRYSGGAALFLNLFENESFSSVRFNQQIDVKEADADEYEVLEVVAINPKLDYLIVRIEEVEGIKPVRLNAAPVRKNQRLVSVSHPSDGPFPRKKMADRSRHCRVARKPLSSDVHAQFGHQCDTTGGSSGSPIYDYMQMSVVGIHNRGGALRRNEEYFSLTKSASKKLSQQSLNIVVNLLKNKLFLSRIRKIVAQKMLENGGRRVMAFRFDGKEYAFEDLFVYTLADKTLVQTSFNEAVSMQAILKDLRKHWPAIYKELKVSYVL